LDLVSLLIREPPSMCKDKTRSVVLHDIVHRLFPGVLCFQHVLLFCGKRVVEKNYVLTTYCKYSRAIIFFFLSFNLLIGWQLSVCNCCKPLSSLLYNCQLLCFWRIALYTVVDVFPRPFSGYTNYITDCKLLLFHSFNLLPYFFDSKEKC
jgi:hypothetical protein